MEHLTNRAIDGYAHGYSLAMWTAVGLALAAAAASLTRGRSTEPVQAAPAADPTAKRMASTGQIDARSGSLPTDS
jgi:hypothetical protein